MAIVAPAASVYCEKFGFDLAKRLARLELLGLGEADHRLATSLQERVIRPHLDEIVGQFYRVLQQSPLFMQTLHGNTTIERLQHSQKRYLLTLGLNFADEAYFESRLRVGMAHVWAKVELSLYQCAYRLLQQLLIDFIPVDARKREMYIAFILKITTLDMTLASEAYHYAQVQGLEESIAQLESRANSLRSRLEHDSLTDVLSRDSMWQLLTEQMAVPPDSRVPACLVMADLDFFKNINDSYGHLIGDQVLRDVAARMRGALRQGDAICRYGGEEFLILLAGSDVVGAIEVAERIRNRIGSDPIHIGGVDIKVTISQGIAPCSPNHSLEQVVERADHALYQAKRLGRDRVEVAAD